MTPTSLIQLALATLLAHDTATLDAVLRPKVKLSKTTFTPAPTRVVADFTEADFDGYAALAQGAGDPQVFRDPASGIYIIQLVEPLLGWTWQTTGVTHLPQTIYGYYVTDNGGTNLYGSELFQTPVVLTASGLGFSIPYARLNNIGGGIF